MTLVQRIMNHEGYRGEPYKDSLGKPTIGYGSLLPITKKEAELLLQHRLYNMMNELDSIVDLSGIPSEKKDILYEMSYQMGVPNLLKFRKMWKALDRFDYNEASEEMLLSLWAEQTPNRANELAEQMKG